MKLNDYYAECLEKGREYQDFVSAILLSTQGFLIIPHTSKKFQYEQGECKFGYEIKFDDLLERTGNLFIEIDEKTNAENKTFVASGIYRNDNAHTYIIGNYHIIFIFSIKHLIQCHKSGQYLVKPSKTDTSHGFLYPIKIAKMEAYRFIEINEDNDEDVVPLKDYREQAQSKVLSPDGQPAQLNLDW